MASRCVFLPVGPRLPAFYGIAFMDEQRLIDRYRSKISRVLIGSRIRLRRVYRRPASLLTDRSRSVVRTAKRFSGIGWLAGWVRRHPRWAALELAGLLLAVAFGLPSASQQTDSVDVEETAIRFDDVEIHDEGGGGFAQRELHSPSPPEVMFSGTPASHLEGSSLSGGPLLVPVPPADPMSRERTARFRPATASASATPTVSRFVRTSRRADGKKGVWLTGTIESIEPAARTAGRTEFNPTRRQ